MTKHNFDKVFEEIRTNILPFLGVFFAIVFVTYGFLYIIDFIPEPIENDSSEATNNGPFGFFEVMKTVFGGEDETRGVFESGDSTVRQERDDSDMDATPNKLTIEALDKEVDVLNPVSNSVAVLDDALLDGVVRHPDSADFEDEGNMLIVGHSSYLPNVFNKNFQALNGIQNLTWGDLITLQSSDTEYIYRVERVYAADATELVVPNDRGEARLTLATCNTFGAKEDRFIVEAVLIETNTL